MDELDSWTREMLVVRVRSQRAISRDTTMRYRERERIKARQIRLSCTSDDEDAERQIARHLAHVNGRRA